MAEMREMSTFDLFPEVTILRQRTKVEAMQKKEK